MDDENYRSLNNNRKSYDEIFFNNHTIMLLIDPINGDIIDANPAAIDFYGYNRNELVNMKISHLNVHAPEIIYKNMQKAVSEEENHFIFKHRKADGQLCDVDVYSGLINHDDRNILYSIIHDITAQKKALFEKQESEKLFQLTFDQSPMGSMIMDLDFTPLRINKALCDMMGYSMEELFSMKFTDFSHPDDLEADLKLHKLLIQGVIDNYTLEKRYINSDGDILWGNLKVSAIKDQSNTLVSILSMVENITKRKNMEKLVQKRTKNLKNINKLLNIELDDHEKAELHLKNLITKLEVSNHELEQFAYVSSHDLKEPLRMITSFLQLLKRRYEDKLDKDGNEFIDFAVEGAKRMDMLINDLLNYSRIGNTIEFEPTDCERVIKLVKTNLKTSIKDNNATITHDPLPEIYANDQQMVMLFQNLIGNAIKYRSQKDPEIHIHLKKNEGKLHFKVQDNGIGINEQYFERIFTIFQRLHTRDEYEGTGVGLAIAKKIVEQHQGNIWVESEPGRGSTFNFTIPYQN